jgi:hypothetical protein
MKVLICLVVCFLSLMGYGQTDTTKIKEYEGWKKGNGSFSRKLSVPNFEKYILKKVLVKDFEMTLGEYDRQWYYSDSTTTYNGGWVIRMPYVIKKTDDEFYDVTIFYDNRTKVISEIDMEVEEDNPHIDKMKQFLVELVSAGYVYDLAAARMRERSGVGNARKVVSYDNKTKKIKVNVLEIEYDHKYKVFFSKTK